MNRMTASVSLRFAVFGATLARLACVVVGALVLSACATSGKYPSLAERDIERISGSAAPVDSQAGALPPPFAAKADASLQTRLAGLAERARQADSAFREAQTAAQQATAAVGGEATGKSRLAAQTAVSVLQTRRSDSIAVLAELDTLYAQAQDASLNRENADLLAITATRVSVQNEVAAQDAAVASLSERLGG